MKRLSFLRIVFALLAPLLALPASRAQAAQQSPSSPNGSPADALVTTVQALQCQAPPIRQLDQTLLQELEAKRVSESASACTTYLLPDVGVLSDGQHYWGVVDRLTPSAISCYISDNEPWDFWAVPVRPGERITFAIESDVRTYFSIENGSVFLDSSALQPNGKYLTGYIWTVPASYSSPYAEISVSPYATSASYTLAVAKASGTPPTSGCSITVSSLCLLSNRFKVEVGWRVPSQGTSGFGHAITMTSDTGHFWFFSQQNVELVVKVLDGRAVTGRYWVFYGALSDVEYTITVTDTQTGTVRTYFNPSGRLASVADTSAF